VREILDRGEPSTVDFRYPGRLRLLNPRTLELTDVPQAPVGARPLAWSPDHRSLLFASDRMTNGRHQVYQLDFDSGEVLQRSSGSYRHIAGALGPDGDLALVRIGLDQKGELRSDILVGLGERKPQVVAPNIAVRHVAMAPNGSAIAYVPRGRTGDQGGEITRTMITVQGLEPGSPAHPLAPGEAPVFSPDGDWIIYQAPHQDEFRLRRMRRDGSARTSIGEGVRNETFPAISPDGRFVVYVSEHNGTDRLFVKRFDGSGDRLLYDGGVVAWPVW